MIPEANGFDRSAESSNHILEEDAWHELRRHHQQEADRLTAVYREAHTRGGKHPIEDFLFSYYSYKPAQLRRWYPGADTDLMMSDDSLELAYFGERWFVLERRNGKTVLRLEREKYLAERGASVAFVLNMLSKVSDRQPKLGCFGLHEWAMVYKSRPDQVRHQQLPLRLGHGGTDEVVESHQIRCTHFDAFRFFTPDAKPLNVVQPTRTAQIDLDQPGCLHVGMDSYRWAYKLAPVIPGNLLLRAFSLAQEIRYVDMQASPYDVSQIGLMPIAIETLEGKTEYERLQQRFSERSQQIRRELIDVLQKLVPENARI